MLAQLNRTRAAAMQLALAALAILALHGIEPPPNNRHTANQWAARCPHAVASRIPMAMRRAYSCTGEEAGTYRKS